MGKFTRVEAQATGVLKEPVIVSVLVAPMNTFSFTKQFGKQFIEAGLGLGDVASVVGGVITNVAEAAAGEKKEKKQAVQLPAQTLLVVSQTQVAFFEWRQGYFRNSIGQLLFRVPRKNVTKFDVGLKTNSPLRHGLALELVGGVRIELEAHIILKKYCQAVKVALNK
ncbi:MAG: hypothetical protein QOE47_594 [Pyrinomonadaceae bacterium]|jgi:hypothetical protein|nr:hypothetical protein [Pyrinomonadaceae bacterium]